MASLILPWIALLFATHALAQTTTSCNPTEKSCPADTALSNTTYTHDFTKGADDDNWNITAGSVSYTSSGAEFTVTKSGDAPTIQSKWYMFFGSVSFHMRSAPGTGIVSSAILESDDLDEIDWEFLGGNANVAQTNYFGKGNTSAHDREVDAAVSNAQSTSHNYTIQWTANATTWYIDGAAVRTLKYTDALSGKNYPQTPMNIRIGIWAGGDSGNAEGTISWAGGQTNYDDGPFTMYLEKVEVVNYHPASSYSYGDMTGDWDSVKIADVDTSKTSASKSADMKSTSSGSAATSTATGTQGTGTASASAVKAQTEPSVGSKLEGLGWCFAGVGVLMGVLSMYP